MLRAFNDTVERIAGKAQLQVSAGDAGFGEDVLERVQSLREIRAAAPVIEAEADPGIPGQGKLLILAVDMTGDRSLRDYDFDNGDEDVIDDPLIFLAQPDSLILTREFAARNHIASAARSRFDTMQGRKQFTVRGILKAGGMAQAFGGNLGIMDIYAAQSVFGRGRHFDRIDIGLQEGVTLEQGEAALQQTARAGLHGGTAFRPRPPVRIPARRLHPGDDRFQHVRAVHRDVHHLQFLRHRGHAAARGDRHPARAGRHARTDPHAVPRGERRRRIDRLRGRRRPRPGLRAHPDAASPANMLEPCSAFAQNVQEVIADPDFCCSRWRMGTGTSMVAASFRAQRCPRRADSGAAKGPLPGARRGREPDAPQCRAARRRDGRGLPSAGGWRPSSSPGILLTLVACLLFTAIPVAVLSRLLRVPLKWLRPVEGALAADSLIQAPRRTSATVAALMLSLALVVGQGGVARGSWTPSTNG